MDYLYVILRSIYILLLANFTWLKLHFNANRLVLVIPIPESILLWEEIIKVPNEVESFLSNFAFGVSIPAQIAEKAATTATAVQWEEKRKRK